MADYASPWDSMQPPNEMPLHQVSLLSIVNRQSFQVRIQHPILFNTAI